MAKEKVCLSHQIIHKQGSQSAFKSLFCPVPSSPSVIPVLLPRAHSNNSTSQFTKEAAFPCRHFPKAKHIIQGFIPHPAPPPAPFSTAKGAGDTCRSVWSAMVHESMQNNLSVRGSWWGGHEIMSEMDSAGSMMICLLKSAESQSHEQDGMPWFKFLSCG